MSSFQVKVSTILNTHQIPNALSQHPSHHLLSPTYLPTYHEFRKRRQFQSLGHTLSPERRYKGSGVSPSPAANRVVISLSFLSRRWYTSVPARPIGGLLA